jgi:hypothetical protein
MSTRRETPCICQPLFCGTSYFETTIPNEKLEGCKPYCNKNPNWASHSPTHCAETWEWHVLLQNRKYCNTILLLLKFLHFAVNSKFDPHQHHKKLYKIQPMFDHLKSRFSSVYIPEQNICVDESLLTWKGWLGWIQYICQSGARLVWKSTNSAEAAQAMFGTS